MISIVMAYHNRYDLTESTIKSMQKSKSRNFEVIIVNDFSNEEKNIHDLPKNYPDINVRIIDMESLGERWYKNPCVVFNAGFSEAKGDKIIIQNPECYHLGDVISYTEENLNDNVYLSFHCYATTKEELPLVEQDLDKLVSIMSKNVVRGGDKPWGGMWCNHQFICPASLNYTTAITRKNLAMLNGFDERLAFGRCGDDNEFRDRIRYSHMNIKFVPQPMTIHQWHPKTLTTTSESAKLPDNAPIWHAIRKDYPTKGIRAYNNGKNIIK